ncbi:hypothetical protein PanWU01x14_315380 [Parasponia andersonii]|uniref:Uncharacterized protein n=1 Tax=Parasponia andersonii TaxID=3476 RepID=A0A2P5ANK4_PARAD|nr:hypothetical protein PanWU01x14_315380 [Parasponia andersonii]
MQIFLSASIRSGTEGCEKFNLTGKSYHGSAKNQISTMTTDRCLRRPTLENEDKMELCLMVPRSWATTEMFSRKEDRQRILAGGSWDFRKTAHLSGNRRVLGILEDTEVTAFRMRVRVKIDGTIPLSSREFSLRWRVATSLGGIYGSNNKSYLGKSNRAEQLTGAKQPHKTSVRHCTDNGRISTRESDDLEAETPTLVAD